jgi:hypothetical protein
MGGQPVVDPPLVLPLVLQVFPLPGSSDPKEFLYNPLPDVHNGAFTAAQTFFLDNGHNVVVCKCPNLAKFQVTRPGVSILPLVDPPAPVFVRGYELLHKAALVMVLASEENDQVAAAAIAPAIGRPPSALMACYTKIPLVSSFSASRVSNCLPGPASIANAPYGSSHCPSSLALRVSNRPPGPASVANASYGSSHHPNPDGFDHPVPVDVYHLRHGGISS